MEFSRDARRRPKKSDEKTALEDHQEDAEADPKNRSDKPPSVSSEVSNCEKKER